MISIAERLDDALINHEAPEREGWTVDSQDSAAWASRKLAKAHAAVEAVSAWEAREIERIREVAEAERRRYRGEIESFEGHLGGYLVRLVAEGRKTKSLDLPGGRVQLRARQPRLEILDEAAAIAWLKAADHGEYVRIKESVDKAALKKALAAEEGVLFLADTGEPVEWASLEEQGDSVSLSPATEEAGEGPE
jgi:hypothetical protein